jgi:two-component system, LytTR family, sensor kinase
MKFVQGFKSEAFRVIKFILILCVVTITIQALIDSHFSWESVKGWTISNFFFGIPFYFANAYLNEGLNKVYSWLKHPKKRALIGIPAFMIMNAGLMVLLIYIYSIVILSIDEPKLFDRRNINSILIAMTICLVATLYFHAVGFFKGYVSQIEVSKKLREEKVNAELNALKSQVNPHFLFNSFNVLSGLIDENPDKAQEFLTGLSKIYRYILENRNEDLSTVREELSFAKQYFKLQQTRFEDSIRIDIDVPEDLLDKKLPSLSLQLLLENAIKHNRFDADNPLSMSILHKVDSLVITNNKRERRNLSGSNGVGLPNIEQRYNLHNVDGFVIDNKQDSFTVILPLI